MDHIHKKFIFPPLRFGHGFAAFITIAILYSCLALVGIGCPILFFAGVPCLGCGMTRAIWNVLHLEFAQAVLFHPLWVLLPPMGLMLVLGQRISKRIRLLFWWTMGTLFMVMYILRLLSPTDPVVKFDLDSGLVVRIFSWIRRRLFV